MVQDWNNQNVLPPFSQFAPYYDQFMLRYVNYRAWVDYIIKIFKHFQIQPKTILDLACGTGIPSILLAQKGYRIIAIDNSQPMLAIFQNKVQTKNYDIKIINADMRNFVVSEKVDVAISLYDSINYLLTESDLQLCFHCVAKTLKPDGLFVFDVNTIFCLENFWDNTETIRQVNNIYSVWQSSFDPIRKISTLRLKVTVDNKVSFEEIHKERGYTEDEIEQNLKTAGFKEIRFYEHSTFLPSTETTLRMMVVARR
ncbi:MAG: class I SAM-dependent methyltransferase [candidate division WOR-3 bacterium]|nr:class I SAM-dependent methyltransferase [candidate division WOR-3 bacterium]